MKVYPINTAYNISNLRKYNSSLENYPSYVSFDGWFGRKKTHAQDEFIKEDKAPENDSVSENIETKELSKLNAHDVMLSLKLADVLHRLNSNSAIVIGNPESLFFKNFVKRSLTEESSNIDNPKNIKDVYILKEDMTDPLIITKDSCKKNSFKLHGLARNLADSQKDYTTYENTAVYDDFIETNNKVKIKFIKTGKESNNIFYDAKIPVDNFYTDSPELKFDYVSKARPCANICTPKVNKQNKLDIPERTFDDIAGMDDTIELVKKKILFPLLYPEAFPKSSNKGTIFFGEPGTGKTLLALAIIGEAKKRRNQDIHFVKIDSQEFERSSFGETEKLWRYTFKELVDKQPAILFIDELDAIVPQRREGSNYVGKNGVVAQLLTLIDGLEKQNERVTIIATTNRPDMIDRAIKRSGRLGNLIEIKKPDEKGCLDILNHYLKDKNVNENFNREEFAEKLYKLSCTGADINAIVDNARDKMYEAYGIYEKMDNGTFEKSDLADLEYSTEDFELTLEDLKNSK